MINDQQITSASENDFIVTISGNEKLKIEETLTTLSSVLKMKGKLEIAGDVNSNKTILYFYHFR